MRRTGLISTLVGWICCRSIWEKTGNDSQPAYEWHRSILFMPQAESYAAFALLMMLAGFSNPLYAVGADAMLADLLTVEKTQVMAMR